MLMHTGKSITRSTVAFYSFTFLVSNFSPVHAEVYMVPGFGCSFLPDKDSQDAFPEDQSCFPELLPDYGLRD